MCGRFFIGQSWEDYVATLRVLPATKLDKPLTQRSNICPTQDIAVVDADGSVRAARWGLVPHWMQKIPAKPMINARGETVAEKPMFRDAFACRNGGRRGFVIADGYYEWADVEGVKTPHRIQLASNKPLLFAAILAHHPTFDALSCAIVTLASDAAVASIHHRMPVILEDNGLAAWMNPQTHPDQALELLAFNRGSELRAEICEAPNGA